MPAVIAVMLVVVCAPDLLHCSPVTPLERAWKSVEGCRLEKARVVHEVRAHVGAKKTVMSACRLFLDEGHRFQRSLLAKEPGPLELSLF
jgi:hypothetical protein